MPSFSDINAKVNSARTSLNSTIDRAGERTGVFKKSGPNGNSSTTRFAPLRSNSQTSNNDYQPPPPPRPPPSTRPGSAAPPPPPARGPNLAPPALPRRTTDEAAQDEEPAPSAASIRSAWQQRDRTSSSQLSAEAKAKGPPPPAPKRGATAQRAPTFVPSPSAPVAPPRAPPSLAAITDKASAAGYPRFSQFTSRDKESFFGLLDEFFGARADPQAPARWSSRKPEPPQVEAQEDEKGPSLPPPPPISLSTRPTATANSSAFAPSHEQHAPLTPAPQQPSEGEAYLLSSYFSSFRTWNPSSDGWFTSTNDAVPPLLRNNPRVRRINAWSQSDDVRTHTGYALYSDLSQAWYTCAYSLSRPFPPQSAEARYRPVPGPQTDEELEYGSQLYGEHLATFAEAAERSKRHVARGECWDLAHEALKSCEGLYGSESKPVESIGRTHGALVWKAGSWGRGAGRSEGEWVGGDVGNVRRGDVIEWRTAKCETVAPTLMCTLGDPDHTAIIVADSIFPSFASNPSHAPPSSAGHITVIEQSLQQIPVRRTYDLTSMSDGEVWIYRPIMASRILGESAGEVGWPPRGYALTA